MKVIEFHVWLNQNLFRHFFEQVAVKIFIITDIFTKGTKKCKTIFEKKFDDCAEAVTWVLKWILCWPMKLTFICDVIGSMYAIFNK